jgi:biotin transport system substrate-specific component
MIRSDIKLTGNILYDDAIYIAISFSAMAILGSIELDIAQGLPITLQSILVVLSGFLFGSRVGVGATVLYLLAGGLGAPIFHGGASSWLHFTGPTAGFLLSFPIAALFACEAANYASKNTKFLKFEFITGSIILFLAQITILILGLGFQDALTPNSLDFSTAVEVLMPGLLVKTAFGTILFVLTGRALKNFNK